MGEYVKGVRVQAGSTVVKNIHPYAIVGVSPAKQFKSRDESHYKKLKELDAF
jgi:acetyltransferase-like isoleucine patch superfamily enzyme